MLTVSSDQNNDQHVTGEYNGIHRSSIGTKYLNASKDIKITYSTKVNNFLNGKWRWAKNTPPYTLYYANSGTSTCVPETDWITFEGAPLNCRITDNMSVSEYDVYKKCLVFDIYKRCEPYDVYRKCDLELTPILTPTPTIYLQYDVYKRCDVTIPITPPPTPFPVPYDEIPPFNPPHGIIRHELTERVWVKAAPTITHVDRNKIKINQTPKKITISGYSMNHTQHVFLSGSEFITNNQQHVDMFSHIPSLSADFPSFYGTPIDFVITNENKIEVYIPALNGTGTIDIILVNRAGYSSMNPPYVFSQWTDYNLQNYLISIE